MIRHFDLFQWNLLESSRCWLCPQWVISAEMFRDPESARGIQGALHLTGPVRRSRARPATVIEPEQLNPLFTAKMLEAILAGKITRTKVGCISKKSCDAS